MHQALMLYHASVLLQLSSMHMPRWDQLHMSSKLTQPKFLAHAFVHYLIMLLLYPLVVLPGCHNLVLCVCVTNIMVGLEVDARIC